MMGRKYFLLLIPFILSVCYTCHNQRKDSGKYQSSTIKKNPVISYATGFNMVDYDSFKLVKVYNPWQGANDITFTYCLSPKSKLSVDKDIYDEFIQVPVRKVVCLSTIHIALIDNLSETKSIAGISGAKYVSNSVVRNGILNKEVVDVGYEQNLNYELIVNMQPDLVFAYAVTGDLLGYINRLKDFGIKVVMVAEYLEQHPLGKAEWLKFISYFYQKENLATMHFNTIKEEYESCEGWKSNYSCTPVILTELPWNNQWYMPGGRSYIAKLIEDAGGKYIFHTDTGIAASPVDIEVIVNMSDSIDFWINTSSANSINDILAVDDRFKEFNPVIRHTVYNNNNDVNEIGGNNYWERGIMEPHVILKDLIHIFHPEYYSNHELVYYKKLK